MPRAAGSEKQLAYRDPSWPEPRVGGTPDGGKPQRPEFRARNPGRAEPGGGTPMGGTPGSARSHNWDFNAQEKLMDKRKRSSVGTLWGRLR